MEIFFNLFFYFYLKSYYKNYNLPNVEKEENNNFLNLKIKPFIKISHLKKMNLTFLFFQISNHIKINKTRTFKINCISSHSITIMI